MFSDLTAPFTRDTNGSSSLISHACTPASARNFSAASIVSAGPGGGVADSACAAAWDRSETTSAEAQTVRRWRRCVIGMAGFHGPRRRIWALLSCTGGAVNPQLDHGPIVGGHQRAIVAETSKGVMSCEGLCSPARR